MNVGIVVQARMSSTRLPGKVLRRLAGKPALQYLLEALRRSQLADRICVATSVDVSDDALAAFCRELDIPCCRGDLDHVAGRCLHAALEHGWESFVRLSGDSPLLDYRLVEQVVTLLADTGAELATNVFPRTFPRGQSVEAVRTEVLRRACSKMHLPRHVEHVTTWFYDHSADYRIASLRSPLARSQVHLALDTPEDETRLAAMLEQMSRPHWEYCLADLLAIHDRLIPSAMFNFQPRHTARPDAGLKDAA
jgi:spore coat polysaccharide biosynthesis protein SpsF